MRHSPPRLVALILALSLPLASPSQPGGQATATGARREPSQNRRPQRDDAPPREAAGREGRALREFVRLRLMLRRIRQQEAYLERTREALADPDGNTPPTPVVTERELSLRTELLDLERARFVDAAQRISSQVLAKLQEVAAQANREPSDSQGAPNLPPRIEAIRSACERIASGDATFESIADELDALAESARGDVPDKVLQERLARLEGEADSLRERLRSIEEEILMIRGDNSADFWGPPSFPRPGIPPGPGGPPPPHQMREEGMFDGRTLPPNHPAMRPKSAGKPDQPVATP